MTVTEQECLEAYELLCEALVRTDYVECNPTYTYQTHEDELGLFYNLIKEHFDNPPFKFEELHEGMWVWDNISKSYRKLYDVLDHNGEWLQRGQYICFDEVSSLLENHIEFEEGRYFLHEVKEND